MLGRAGSYACMLALCCTAMVSFRCWAVVLSVLILTGVRCRTSGLVEYKPSYQADGYHIDGGNFSDFFTHTHATTQAPGTVAWQTADRA